MITRSSWKKERRIPVKCHNIPGDSRGHSYIENYLKKIKKRKLLCLQQRSWRAHSRPLTEQVITAKYVIDGWVYLQHDEVPHLNSALKTHLPRSFLRWWIGCGDWNKFVYSGRQASFLYILTCGSRERFGVPGKHVASLSRFGCCSSCKEQSLWGVLTLMLVTVNTVSNN